MCSNTQTETTSVRIIIRMFQSRHRSSIYRGEELVAVLWQNCDNLREENCAWRIN